MLNIVSRFVGRIRLRRRKSTLSQEPVSVTLLGDSVPIGDMRATDFLFNKDSMIYVALISFMLTAIATISNDVQNSLFLNALTWTLVCTLFFINSYIMTKTFSVVAPRLGLKRLLVPLSCIPNVHVLHIFKQFLDSFFQPEGVNFFTYDFVEITYIYVIVQIANIIFVRYDVSGFRKDRIVTPLDEALQNAEPSEGGRATTIANQSFEHSMSKKHFWIDRVLIQAMDVLYATAQEHYLSIKTPEGEIQVRGQIQILEKELGVWGMRVHRSHWVSKHQVRSLHRVGRKHIIVLKDATEIPLAASRKRQFEDWIS